MKRRLDAIRSRRPSHGTAIAYLALFVALGGTSWALATGSIGSREIKNNTVRSKDIRNRTIRGRDVRSDTLGGKQVKESSLGIVPSAQNALTLSGLSASQLKVRCPTGTIAKAGACLESATATSTYAGASTACANRSRRLPTQFELTALAEGGGGVSASAEWTQSVFESRSAAGRLDTVLVNNVGAASFAQAGGPVARRYRCVASPVN